MASLHLEDEDIQILLTTYQQRQRDLQTKLEALQSEKRKVEEKITSLLKQAGKPINGYNAEWTWNEKISYVLGEDIVGTMSASEIVDQILELEPALERVTTMRSVSATLSVGADKGKYRKYIREGKDMQYELVQ